MRSPSLTAAVLLAAALGSCGSVGADELPPPATPPASPTASAAPAGTVLLADRVAPALRDARGAGSVAALPGGGRVIVHGRARTLELRDRVDRRRATVAAGVGPTVATCLDRATCVVLDTAGDGLLVFAVDADRGALRLMRRAYLAGGPTGLAIDRRRRRLWVTAPGRDALLELPAHRRPHVLSHRPTVRRANRVAVDPASGTIIVHGLRRGRPVVALVRP